METNQGRELAGCKFTQQLERGATMVSAADRYFLALSVFSLFHERNRLYKWFMGTFTSLIHEKKFVIDQDVLLIKMSFICLKKKKNNKKPSPLHMWSDSRDHIFRSKGWSWGQRGTILVCSLLASRCPSRQIHVSSSGSSEQGFLKKDSCLQSLLTFDELRGKRKRTQIHVREEVP